ncbi:MAG: hypothetical protein ACTIDZ_06980 [Staphylococcus sp.]|uniref:hypothetical protein n=1 Tax=Staphylococcus sp. TaxID=29387 RepID=UPI003F9BFD52
MYEFINILISGLVAAIVTGVWNIRNTNKTVHAQVVSKARHEWIQEVRKLVSDYITDTTVILNDIKDSYSEQDEYISKRDVKRIDSMTKNIENKSNQIILFFGERKTIKKNGSETTVEDKVNQKYNKVVKNVKENIYTMIESAHKISEKNYDKTDLHNITTLRDETKTLIKDIVANTSEYLKTEWYNTKEGK